MANFIPAIIFGSVAKFGLESKSIPPFYRHPKDENQVNVFIKLSRLEFKKHFEKNPTKFRNLIHEVAIEHDAEEELKDSTFSLMIGKKFKVLPKTLTRHHLTDDPLSVCFMVVGGEAARVSVPITFTDINLSGALKRGGTLNRAFWNLPLIVKGEEIPTEITCSVGAKEMNSKIIWSDLPISKNPNVSLDPRIFNLKNKNLNPTLATIKPSRQFLKDAKSEEGKETTTTAATSSSDKPTKEDKATTTSNKEKEKKA